MSKHNRKRRQQPHMRLTTREEHRQFCVDNADHLAAIAWHGFQQGGQGFINVFVDNLQGDVTPGSPISGKLLMYVPAKLIVEQGKSWPTPEMPRWMKEYDPETEFVILFHWQKGEGERLSNYRLMPSTPPRDTIYLGDVGQIRVRC